MTAQPFARPRTLLVAAIAALLALAAFAGPAAAHHHGHHHHDRHLHHIGGDSGGAAGTISSFDPASGKLVINLAESDTASGLVTEFTHIDCGCGHGSPPSDGRQALHFGSGDDHGWGDPHGSSCDSSDLVAGAAVKDALVVLKDGHAYFAMIELDH